MSPQDEARLKELTEEVLRSKGIEASAESFLRSRGIAMSMEELFDLVLDQLGELPKVERRPSLDVPSPQVRRRLEGAGVTFEAYEGGRDPVATSIARYSDLVASSFSTQEAAERLGVGESRIRQLLNHTPPRVYGFKKDSRGAWRIPRFQFGKDGLVPGIRDVIAALDSGLHPLEVITWFETPVPDLQDDDGRQLSPLQWLRTGRDVDRVVRVADRVS